MQHTWRSLNEALTSLSEQQVKGLLEQELAGPRRRSVLERLHQRYNTLRVARERMEMFENPIQYAAKPDTTSANLSKNYNQTISLQTLLPSAYTVSFPLPKIISGSNPVAGKVSGKKSCPQAVAYIKPLIQNKLGAFQNGIIGSPFHKLCESLSRQNPSGKRISYKDLAQALNESGWIDRGRVSSRDFNTKRHVFIHPEHDPLSKSQISRLFETGAS